MVVLHVVDEYFHYDMEDTAAVVIDDDLQLKQRQGNFLKEFFED